MLVETFPNDFLMKELNSYLILDDGSVFRWVGSRHVVYLFALLGTFALPKHLRKTSLEPQT